MISLALVGCKYVLALVLLDTSLCQETNCRPYSKIQQRDMFTEQS